jgi:hypothetical protein
MNPRRQAHLHVCAVRHSLVLEDLEVQAGGSDLGQHRLQPRPAHLIQLHRHVQARYRRQLWVQNLNFGLWHRLPLVIPACIQNSFPYL